MIYTVMDLIFISINFLTPDKKKTSLALSLKYSLPLHPCFRNKIEQIKLVYILIFFKRKEKKKK